MLHLVDGSNATKVGSEALLMFLFVRLSFAPFELCRVFSR